MKSKNLKLNKSVYCILLLFITSIGSAFVTVGPTNDCDYSNLEDAYNDADAFVRVTTHTLNDSFTISKTKWITGGYLNCQAAEDGDPPTGHTVWMPSAINMTTVDIDANSSSIVVLDNFDIQNGSYAAFEQTGGIRVRGDVALTLANSLVHHHLSDVGAINLSGEDTRVLLTNTKVYNNISNSYGGGIACYNNATLSILGESSIDNNSTNGDGGGIYASSGCQVTSQSGDSNPLLQAEYGIINNTAEGQGGGIYIATGADVELLGNNEHPASIVGNISNIDTTNVIIGGGGVYVRGDGEIPSDGTTFTATNARIDFNIAIHAGAGVGVTSGGTFTMQRGDGDCWDNDKCSSLSQNILTDATGNGAAGYIYDVASANISGTYIYGNQANEAALFELNQVGTLRMEGNLITGNGPFTQAFASELFSVIGNNGFASNLDMYYNTIAGNNVNTHFYMNNTSSQQWVKIYNSIIFDQGDIVTSIGGIDPNLVFNCNFVHETDSLSVAQSAIDNFDSNPNFVDAANGDYHVISGSLSKDLCNENLFQSNYKDLNGRTRGLSDPNVPDLRGPFDAGAYENYDNENIFKNGFE